MKKNYNQPKLNIIEIEEVVAIATSTVHKFGFDGDNFDNEIVAEDWIWN